ncbi:transposase, partial [Paenibacillus sp. TRM 82003]|nr:transposase [Paenibacillus sp. TRM 82003]
QYPLLYSIWQKDNGVDPHQSKLELALQMLQRLRDQVGPTLRLWACFDSFYQGKDFYLAVEQLNYHWVTRAKSNHTFYRKIIERGKERFIAITPDALFKEARPVFAFYKKRAMCMSFKDIYLLTNEIPHGRGKRKEKVLKPLNVVVTTFQEEDLESGTMKQVVALLHSNNLAATAEEIVNVYRDRWSIETFFRNAKQELGLTECHSTNENHIHAHLSLLFVAESLVRIAQWEFNKKTGTGEEITHRQVVDLLLQTRCEVQAISPDNIQVYFDFFQKYFPRYLHMGFELQKSKSLAASG